MMIEQAGYSYVPVNPGWDHVVDNLSTVPVMSHLCVFVEGLAQLFVAGIVNRHGGGAAAGPGRQATGARCRPKAASRRPTAPSWHSRKTPRPTWKPSRAGWPR